MEENEKYKLSTKKLREIAQMEMADKESRITEIKEILMISEKAKDKLQRL